MSTKKLIKGFLLLLWCSLIFYLSASGGEESRSMSDGILHLFLPGIPEYAGLLVRKAAHFTEYMVLALLAYSFFCEFFSSAYFPTFWFTALYALTDEFHQLFVQGRSGQITDVMIDLFGSVFGLMVIFLCGRRKNDSSA